MKDTFYITTPIYYVNDVPHIGHAYTTVACDVIARYRRLRGEKVFFLTGTDEHGQTNLRAAQQRGLKPQEWVDQIVPQWKEVWERLEISYDDFIRTTEERHGRSVQDFVQRLYDAGDVYLGTYEGLYCISCEEFKTGSEILDGQLCAIHKIPLERVQEQNYFFRLSAYQDRLLKLYEDHPEFVRPETRMNEMVAFVKGGLQDFSMSRTSFDWGVPIPWDPKHVVYVWVDALFNYITATGFGVDEQRFRSIWPADVHMMSKDILRFHAVFWPAMLMSAGLPVPRSVFVHGYLLVGGEKMSKTRLTGIHPFQLTDHFGVDAYRYYFLREVPFGQDGSFSWESMAARYNAELANGLGNLASRVLAMVDANVDGLVPERPSAAAASPLEAPAAELARAYDEGMGNLNPTAAVTALSDFVGEMNRYLVDVAPWALAKDPARRDELATILYDSLEGLRLIAIFSFPVMPGAAERLWTQLGVAEPLADQRLPAAASWGGLRPGTRIARGEALFPRLDD